MNYKTFSVKPAFILLLAGFLFVNDVVAQYEKFSVRNGHAHNDYLQAIPFRNAYSAGFGSIEVDICLKDGQLYVAHDLKLCRAGFTLDKFYLPLLAYAVKTNRGFPYPDSTAHLQILIDIKTDANKTLKAVVSSLQKFPQLINCRNLRFIISGNVPSHQEFDQYPAFIYFDGKPDKSEDLNDPERIGLFSANLKNYSSWNGKSNLSSEEKDRLTTVIQKVKKLNRQIRFWNAPDMVNAWYQLMHLGVDFINTDKICDFSKFAGQLRKSSCSDINIHETYSPLNLPDNTRPKNIILLIGDGMGLTQLYAAGTANKGKLNIFNISTMGLSATPSADSYVTDSGAGGTAMATGEKANNRAIAVNSNGKSLPSLTTIFKQQGKHTAVISSGDITDATPAVFYSHVKERSMTAEIVADLEKTDIDIIAGGGNINFKGSFKRKIFSSLNELSNEKQWIVLDDKALLPAAKGRGEFLLSTLNKTLQTFNNSANGFFIMAEGAQIDYGGHENDLCYVINELLDFDKMVGAALRFADENKETLVIITADHETGGLTLLDGNISKGQVSGNFSTNDHTAVPVPVFAYGRGAKLFSGYYENTAIFEKIKSLLKP